MRGHPGPDRPGALADLSVERAELACAWEDIADRGDVPPTWRLARRLVEGGAAGMVVPSFAHGAISRDVNLVFWTWSRELPHRIVPVDDHGRLPRNDLSWR